MLMDRPRNSPWKHYYCLLKFCCDDINHACNGNVDAIYDIICYTDISVTFAGSIINNGSLLYFDEIGKQDSTSGLVCQINNFNVSCDRETNNSQIYVTGDWFFPNGDRVPLRIATQTTSIVFTQRSSGGTELHQLGHPSETGRYFCTAPNTDNFYVYLSRIFNIY